MPRDEVVDFAHQRAREEQRQIEAFIQAPDAQPTETTTITPPTKPAERKPYVLEAAGKAVVGAVAEGGKNIAESIYPPTPPEPGMGAQASAIGQRLLGLLQIATSPFPGIIAGVEQAVRNWTPESGKTVILPGGQNSPAGYTRAILGVAGLALDPAIRKADPRAVEQMLNADMTLDEFLGTLAAFATPFAGKAKGLLKGKKGEPPPPPPGGPAPPQLALPEHPRPPLVTPPPLTPEQAAIELRTVLEGIPSPARQPQAQLALPPHPPDPIPLGAGPDLRSVLEGIQKPTEPGAPARNVRPSEPPPTVLSAPEAPTFTTSIVDDLGRRIDLPPQVADPMIERARLRAFERTKLDQPSAVIPEAPSPAAAAPAGGLTTALEKALTRAEAIIAEDLKAGADAAPSVGYWETGTIDPALLARMAIGAAAGGAVGDTPEEKMVGALVGFVGGAMAKRLALKLAPIYKKSGLADETGAFDFSKFVKTPAIQKAEEFQPNYDRISAPTDVTRTMKNIHRAVADRITEAMRKPTSHSEETKAAWELIQSGKVTVESVLADTPISIEQMPAYGKAVRDLSVGSATEVVRVAKALVSGEAVGAGELAQAAALSGEMGLKARTFQTRSGQTVSAFRIKAEDAGVRGGPGTTPERIQAIADGFQAGRSEIEMAQMILADTSTKRVRDLTSFWSALPDALLEGMYASMFSGLSIERNILGNVVMGPLSIGARAFSEGLGVVESAIGIKNVSRVWPGETAAMAMAWWNGMGEQIAMLRSWKQWQDHATNMGKLQETHHAMRGIERLAETMEPGTPQEVLRGIGTVVRKPLEVMNGTDASSRAIARGMAIDTEAIAQAHTEGLTGQARAARVETLRKDPSQFTPTAKRAIAEFEQELTFTKDLEGRVGSAIQAGPTDPWLNLVYRATLVPVFRTAVRIAESQIDYSGNPLLSLVSKRFRDDMLAGGRRRQIAEGKMMLGATAFAGFTYLALNDFVTGSVPTDPKKRAIWGKPETSWWDPVSRKYRSYAGMEPVTGHIKNAADMVQYAKELPETDYLKLFVAHILTSFNNLESQNWWLGVSDMLKLITGTHGQDDQVTAGLDIIRKRLALWSPGFLAEVEKGVDPGVRSAKPSGAIAGPMERELEALRARYAARTPFFSTAKDERGFDLYPMQRDPLTGVQRMTESWPFTIFGIQPDKRSPARNEIDRLQPEGIGELPDHIGGAGDAGGIGLSPPKIAPAAGTMIGRNEKDRWVEIMTQQVKYVDGKTLMASMEELVASDLYTGSKERPTSDFRKRELLTQRWNWFREQAEGQLLEERPALKAAVLAKRAEPRILRQSPTDQPAVRQQYDSLIKSLSP